MKTKAKPAVLLILDGWGINENKEHNAIAAANKPNWDHLWATYPTASIRTSGPAVGLPSGQMGNSEVGHLNLGSGRVVYQEFTRVSRSIRTGSFFTNLTLTNAVDTAIKTGGAIHILGLLSPGGVHSHQDHIHAMVKLAIERKAKKVFVHAWLDGRDMPPKSAEGPLKRMNKLFEDVGGGRIATIIGRYFSMDRDSRWNRIQKAYDLITLGEASYSAKDPLEGLEMAYERGETDEFISATSIGDKVVVEDGDVIINMNCRSDRARQITCPFIFDNFKDFDRKAYPNIASYVSLTELKEEFDIPVAYPSERLINTFGEYIARSGMRQLRIAETEKYAHVTFFFNGGVEKPNEGEDRVLVNSPDVATYDLKPEMSAFEVTDKLVHAIEGNNYDVIICNFANGDMVGHSGIMKPAIEAIEVLDKCIGRVISALEKVKGEALITADHGNAEQMMDSNSNQPHTSHTTNLVPLIYIGDKTKKLLKKGALCDISPTLLEMMGLEKPVEMTGRSLFRDES